MRCAWCGLMIAEDEKWAQIMPVHLGDEYRLNTSEPIFIHRNMCLPAYERKVTLQQRYGGTNHVQKSTEKSCKAETGFSRP